MDRTTTTTTVVIADANKTTSFLSGSEFHNIGDLSLLILSVFFAFALSHFLHLLPPWIENFLESATKDNEMSSEEDDDDYEPIANDTPFPDEDIFCECGLQAKLRVSHTAWNPFRLFYNCPKSINKQCGFFCWFDEESLAYYDQDGKLDLICQECIRLKEQVNRAQEQIDEMLVEYEIDLNDWDRERFEILSNTAQLADMRRIMKIVNDSELMPPVDKLCDVIDERDDDTIMIHAIEVEEVDHTLESEEANTGVTVVDDSESIGQEDTVMPENNTVRGLDNPEILCECGLRAKLRVSHSANNPSRFFYNCPRATDQCGFFCWADEPASTGDRHADGLNLMNHERTRLQQELTRCRNTLVENQQLHDNGRNIWERERSELMTNLTELTNLKKRIEILNASGLMPPDHTLFDANDDDDGDSVVILAIEDEEALAG